MLRRVLVVTVMAVGLSAAGALAFAPGFARIPIRWAIASWSGGGFTPAPRARDTSAVTRDPNATAVEGGVPGTYCPIRPRDPAATTVSSGVSIDLPLAATGQTQSKPDAANAQSGMCPVPPSATATPRSILP